ncbi:MAG: DUF3276 family protein [Ginsengibacter sp.]
MAYDSNDKKQESVYSARIRAGKRRTYFFDVRATRSNDYYLTITESRKRFNEDGYDRHKLFLYKEDFNKFIKGLTEAVEYVKTDLMPDFDFDAFNHDQNQETHTEPVENRESENPAMENKVPDDEPDKEDTSIADKPAPEADTVVKNTDHEEVDKW